MQIFSVRYSVNRKKEYQIKTLIYEDEGVKLVKKEPYSEYSIEHIKNIYKNYSLLNSSPQSIIKPTISNNVIIFPFVEGESFATVLVKEIKKNNINGFISKLIWYKNLLLTEETTSFKMTQEFEEVFNNFPQLIGAKSFKISNIDLNFENLLIDEKGKVTIIDYEWVFNFPIPVEFVLYRSLFLFFNTYSHYLKNFVSLETIYKLLEIKDENLSVYEEMQNYFHIYVNGGWSKQKKNYLKNITTMNQVYDLVNYDNKQSVTVFWGDTTDFIEKESISVEINHNQLSYEIDLPLRKISNLRIDPGSMISYIKMSIKLRSNKQETNLLSYLTRTNGIYLLTKSNNLVEIISLNDDPQLIFEGITLEKGKKQLYIELSILKHSESEKLIEIIEERKKEIDSKNALISNIERNLLQIANENIKLQREIRMKTEELTVINEKFANLNTLYRQTISTTGWRILEFLRKFKL